MTAGERESGADRRVATRYLTCYPLNIQTGDSGHTGDLEIALIHDLSELGAFVLTTTALSPDARVKLHLDFGETADLVVEGRVVRCTRRPAEVAELWHFGAAVAFVEVDAKLAESIRAVARSVAEK